MQVLRLRGPARVLAYVLSDVWLLYRLYVSARALDEIVKERQQREAEIAHKREQQQRERDESRREMKETLGFDPFDEFELRKRMEQQQRSAQQTRSDTRPNPAPPPPRSQPEPPRQPYSAAELEQDLDAIVGLQNVKQTIRDIYAQVNVQQQRVSQGIGSGDNTMSLHMLFLGNPGTGKTMVARLVGEMFKKMGVLSKGHFIETDATGLVGQYLGQTRHLTEAKIQEAMGGVLFIDEAYSIIDPDNHSGANSYGKEAIQVLIKQMEDHRDDLCVILAGYPDEMNTFIRTNPGTKSRIAFHLHFDNYSPSDLMKINRKMCQDWDFQFDAQALNFLRSQFAKNAQRVGSLGNGRWVRNVLEVAIRKQSRRLSGKVNSHEALQTITLDDVVAAWEEEHDANGSR